MNATVTVTITDAILPHVREILAHHVGDLAEEYAGVLNEYADQRCPFVRVGRASTVEAVMEAREALHVAERMLDDLGLEGGAREFTAPPELLAKFAQSLIETGSDTIGQAILSGDMTREETDRWYLAECTAGIELRELLGSARGMPSAR